MSRVLARQRLLFSMSRPCAKSRFLRDGPTDPRTNITNDRPTSRKQHSGGRNRQGGTRPRKQATSPEFILLVFSTIGFLGYYLGIKELPTYLKQPYLDKRCFRHFKVVEKQQVSSTAYILTVEPDFYCATPDLPGGLWSVEIKQPNLQIARHYTPLPPLPGESLLQLRFLVRQYDGGEVSTYLSKREVGSIVELRGPHPGFDVKRRLGKDSKHRTVLFIAGGTGIAPALQVAYALRDEGTRVEVLWANRKREDCQGCHMIEAAASSRRNGGSTGWLSSSGITATSHDKAPGTRVTSSQTDLSLVVNEFNVINQHATNSAPHLSLQCAVDEENTYIQPPDIMSIIRQAAPPQTPSPHSAFPPNTVDLSLQDDLAPSITSPFRGHGNDLVLISGPDGFVNAYAGPKKWDRGAERQGELGGVLGMLRQRYPEEWRGWTVLKL